MSDTISKPRRKRGWMNLEVKEVLKETHDTKTFLFKDAESQDVPFDYRAGQYLTFRFDDLSEKPIVRSYTMSSSPCQQDYIAVTVKAVPKGLVSNWFIDSVEQGMILKARGPIGKFCFFPQESQKNLVMVAAGSGVTPFVSILRQYQDTLGSSDAPKSMVLLVAYRSQDDLICWQELLEFSKKTNIKIVTTLTRENAKSDRFIHGRPDQEMFDKVVEGNYENSIFMTCGPQGLMDMVTGHLQTKNVPEDCILTESFD